MSKNNKVKVSFNRVPVRFFFKTLYSNDAAYNAAMTKKWYRALVIFFISIIIAAIPQTVQSAQVQGNQSITQTNNDQLANGLYYFYNDANSEYDISFNEGKASLIDSEGNFVNYTSNKPFYVYSREQEYSSEKNSIQFEMYYVSGTYDVYSTFLSDISATQSDGLTRTTSYMVFNENYFYFALYSSASTSASQTLSGNFLHLSELYGDSFTFKNAILSPKDGQENIPATFVDNMKDFADNVYRDTRTNSILVSTGLILIVNSITILLMGLIFFLMTRGKSNPNRTMKLYQAYNLAFRSSLSPAIISLALGFLFSGYAIMVFIVCYGFRAMYLSMRQLKPAPKA